MVTQIYFCSAYSLLLSFRTFFAFFNCTLIDLYIDETQLDTNESRSKNGAERNDKIGSRLWELDKLLQCLHIPAPWRCGRGNILTMPNQGGNIQFDVPQSASFNKQS